MTRIPQPGSSNEPPPPPPPMRRFIETKPLRLRKESSGLLWIIAILLFIVALHALAFLVIVLRHGILMIPRQEPAERPAAHYEIPPTNTKSPRRQDFTRLAERQETSPHIGQVTRGAATIFFPAATDSAGLGMLVKTPAREYMRAPGVIPVL